MRCSTRKFTKVAKYLNLQLKENERVLYVEIDDHFWVGVNKVHFMPLNFPPYSLIIGYQEDVEEIGLIDATVPYHLTSQMVLLLSELAKKEE